MVEIWRESTPASVQYCPAPTHPLTKSKAPKHLLVSRHRIVNILAPTVQYLLHNCCAVKLDCMCVCVCVCVFVCELVEGVIIAAAAQSGYRFLCARHLLLLAL